MSKTLNKIIEHHVTGKKIYFHLFSDGTAKALCDCSEFEEIAFVEV